MVTKTISSQSSNNATTAKQLAERFFQQEGRDTQRAGKAMAEYVLASPSLTAQFRNSAFLQWAHIAVQGVASSIRAQSIQPLEPVPQTTRSTISAPTFQPSARTFTRQQQTSAETIMDMPLYGRTLGDWTGNELLENADRSDQSIAREAKNNTFARSVAHAMQDLSQTVRVSLTEQTLEQLQAAL